ncbi:MAG: hypothetical protein Greene07144_1142 [Parcubacteria group bacterium Greene0714_4]|nr:MAG: hypothetical protein Greene101415_1166 [Parcubacteria group bacterium Greene1014_15]TSD06593.1 MAG: hypothetical protein Greene07144_1142 [Parcubacteria group bacterium Greene0714_4]
MTDEQQGQAKKYILIAEDDSAYGNVYQSKLENEGYEVKVTNSGDAVLAEIHSRKPDLLILDLMMLDKDGFEVLEELQNQNLLNDIKVIVASNLSQDADRQKVKKFNILDYFVKSDISVTEMVEKIKTALK